MVVGEGKEGGGALFVQVFDIRQPWLVELGWRLKGETAVRGL